MTPINISSVAIAERYAREHFGLLLPITPAELKSAFRRKAKELHTDTSGDATTKGKFIAMKDAYDFLVKLEGMNFVYGEKVEGVQAIQLETIDGTPLYELGLGLGPMKNGRPCDRCLQKGYTEEQTFVRRGACLMCDWRGLVYDVVPCKPCKGTGRFTQGRSRQTVTCRACLGLGTKTERKACSECLGKKYVGKKGALYSKCYECNGTGEIELFSPLFPKGRFINKVSNKK